MCVYIHRPSCSLTPSSIPHFPYGPLTTKRAKPASLILTSGFKAPRSRELTRLFYSAACMAETLFLTSFSFSFGPCWSLRLSVLLPVDVLRLNSRETRDETPRFLVLFVFSRRNAWLVGCLLAYLPRSTSPGVTLPGGHWWQYCEDGTAVIGNDAVTRGRRKLRSKEIKGKERATVCMTSMRPECTRY